MVVDTDEVVANEVVTNEVANEVVTNEVVAANIKNKNNRLYKFIRENGGLEKWTYRVLMQRNIPNDDERYMIEAELINQYDIKNCLNKNIPNNFKQYEKESNNHFWSLSNRNSLFWREKLSIL